MIVEQPSREHPPRRVAIIGAGVSGLVAAYRLRNAVSVRVFERDERIGGHTNTIDVEFEGASHAIDTGFIVFNTHNYPIFCALLDELGVKSRPSEMSFSVRCDQTGIEYNGSGLNGLFAQRSNVLRPSFHVMIRDIVRFNRLAKTCLGSEVPSVSIEAFVRAHGFGQMFMEYYLIPMGASIWSCPPGTFRTFPLRFVLNFFENHRMLDLRGRPVWRVISGGSREYVKRLVASFPDRLRTGCPVVRVRRRASDVVIETCAGTKERFDHVIFACHADQALRMLGDDATPLERTTLRAFPYQKNEVVLHTDTSLLPRRRRAWAAWNYHRTSGDQPEAMITYNMNILQGIASKHTFCVTLNETDAIDERRVLGRFTYEHPVFTAARDRAAARHCDLVNSNRTSYCGAYWGYGFHEDGVRSATRVADALFGDRVV